MAGLAGTTGRTVSFVSCFDIRVSASATNTATARRFSFRRHARHARTDARTRRGHVVILYHGPVSVVLRQSAVDVQHGLTVDERLLAEVSTLVTGAVDGFRCFAVMGVVILAVGVDLVVVDEVGVYGWSVGFSITGRYLQPFIRLFGAI